MATITIDGKNYDTDTFSTDAKAQLMSLQMVDQEIGRLNMQLAIAQTARNAYARALAAQLPGAAEAGEAGEAAAAKPAASRRKPAG